MANKPTTRRRIAITAVWLVVGLVVTLLVSWIPLFFLDRAHLRPAFTSAWIEPPSHNREVVGLIRRNSGDWWLTGIAEHAVWTEGRPVAKPDGTLLIPFDPRTAWQPLEVILQPDQLQREPPSWLSSRTGGSHPPRGMIGVIGAGEGKWRVTRWRSGWPAWCLEGFTVQRSDLSEHNEGLIEISQPGMRAWTGTARSWFPIMPILTGMAINIPLWAAISFLLFTTAAWIRGRVMRLFFHRPVPGSCPRCRYDRTRTAPGSPCPECGSTARPIGAARRDHR